MKKFIFTVGITLSFLSGGISPQQVAAEDVSRLLEKTQYDFSISPFELWQGTELQPLQLPEIEFMEDSTFENSTRDDIRKQNKGETDKLSFKESEKETSSDLGDGLVSGQLSFADPIDFEIWKLVKWTIVVLVIASGSTYFYRLKKPSLQTEQIQQQLKLVETLNINPRVQIHLLWVGTEKYLVASDIQGVKSLTLVPNWQGEEDFELPDAEDLSRAEALPSIAS